MNFQQRFLEIQDFMKPYQKIWQNEIMLKYPDFLDGYSREWVEELRAFQDKETVIRLEKKEVFDYIKNPELIELYRRIVELEKLPQIPELPPLKEERNIWLYIIPKKQHEIKRLAPYLNQLYHERKIKNVVDIGGGIGLLAQILNNQYQMNITTIDMNAEFQKTGDERNKFNAKNPANRVQYKNMKVEEGGDFAELLDSGAMPIGLHTCGKLAIDQIRIGSANKVPAMVNFGCCYHTLEKDPAHQRLSRFAQENEAFWMTKFALTLSCRAHRKMDEKDYDLKMKVKFFRYSFHILLNDHYGEKELISLGNSSPKLYDESFGIYALEQFKRIHIEPKHNVNELNDFFANPKLKVTIEQMLAAGLIRNAMGRILEIYLLLDRAIYLEEQGYTVKVEEFFIEELSPRNIGITGILV
jgi:hypothetical protein